MQSSRQAVLAAYESAEREARRLRLLHFPAPLAAYAAATAFEDSLRLLPPSLFAISARRAALNHILRWVFGQHGGVGCDPKFSQSAYEAAYEALDFAERFDSFHQMAHAFFAGRCLADVRGSRITFVEPTGGSKDRDVAGQILSLREEDLAIETLLIKEPPDDGAILAACAQTISIDLDGSFTYEPHPLVLAHCRRVAQHATSRTMFPGDFSNGSYTLGEARGVWYALKALGLQHQLYTGAAARLGAEGLAVRSILLALPEELLVESVSDIAEVHAAAARVILSDLVLPNSARCDLVTHPLLRFGNNLILVPQLIGGLKWEVSTALLWARQYSGDHGATIASYKKHLEREFASAFDARRFEVSNSRTFMDNKGQHLGDVDVAVFDRADRRLLLFQIKWLAPVERMEEIIKADEALRDAQRQCATALTHLQDDSARFMKTLFPKKSLPAPDQVDAFVLSRGSLGTEAMSSAEFMTLDYDSTYRIVRSGWTGGLDELCSIFSSQLAEITAPADFAFTYKNLVFDRWTVRIPQVAYGPASAAIRPGRNDPCPCGSGRKYKKCHSRS